MHSAITTTPRPSGDGGPCSSGTRCCRLPGCTEALPPGYHTKYRICRHHCQAQSQEVDGKTVRFCQQCGRFHALDEFDAARRSCRASLSQHKMRRHLAKQHAEDEKHSGSAAPLGEGTAEGNGKRGRQQAEQEEEPHPRQKAAPQPGQAQLQPVLPVKLPCSVYVAPPQSLQLPPQLPAGHWASHLQAPPQPPPGHWASCAQPPAQQFDLPPAVPSQASVPMPAAWWCLATASHASGSARVLLQPVAPAMPGAAGAGAPAGPFTSTSPVHGPSIGKPPLPAPLAAPQAACDPMRPMMETSPSLELILAFDADLGLDLGSQWDQLPAGAPSHPDFERPPQGAHEGELPQQQEDHHQQLRQQQADGLQLPSRWSLAGPQAAQTQAEQAQHWERAGSSGVCRQPAAAAVPAHTTNSADSTLTAQLQAWRQDASAGKQQGADAQPSGAHAAPPVPSVTAAPHNPGTGKAQRRRSSRMGPSQPLHAVVQAPRAAPAAPTPSEHVNYRPVTLCPRASVCPTMCSPPLIHPDDRIYLQQLSLSLSEDSLPPGF